jgi:hypothetical protein
MSERTAPALSKLDQLIALLNNQPKTDHAKRLIEDAEALRRAVDSFHMEAIRFRMYSVDRDLKEMGNDPALRSLYEELRHTLEAGGFHTRSHTAP